MQKNNGDLIFMLAIMIEFFWPNTYLESITNRI